MSAAILPRRATVADVLLRIVNFFTPPAWLAIGALAFALLSGLGIHYARLYERDRLANAAICREKIAAIRARNPYVERYFVPDDPCLALKVLAQEARP